MSELSQRTLQIIQCLFAVEQWNEVEQLLNTVCRDGLIHQYGAEWDALRERILLGILKLSDGNRDDLMRAIALAQTDWRDVLVAAGFGDSITEHENWAREKLETVE